MASIVMGNGKDSVEGGPTPQHKRLYVQLAEYAIQHPNDKSISVMRMGLAKWWGHAFPIVGEFSILVDAEDMFEPGNYDVSWTMIAPSGKSTTLGKGSINLSQRGRVMFTTRVALEANDEGEHIIEVKVADHEGRVKIAVELLPSPVVEGV